MGIGCAEYSGRDSSDAKRYIDNSQGRRGFARYKPAHPRNHCASTNSDCDGPCIEKYSQGGRKSGFLSRQDQDLVGHYVLSHPRVQRELNILNQYDKDNKNDDNYIRRSVDISANELQLPKKIMGGEWRNGTQTSTFDIKTLTIVLQHFDGQETNPHAPVHILTFFPRYVT